MNITYYDDKSKTETKVRELWVKIIVIFNKINF